MRALEPRAVPGYECDGGRVEDLGPVEDLLGDLRPERIREIAHKGGATVRDHLVGGVEPRLEQRGRRRLERPSRREPVHPPEALHCLYDFRLGLNLVATQIRVDRLDTKVVVRVIVQKVIENTGVRDLTGLGDDLRRKRILDRSADVIDVRLHTERSLVCLGHAAGGSDQNSPLLPADLSKLRQASIRPIPECVDERHVTKGQRIEGQGALQTLDCLFIAFQQYGGGRPELLRRMPPVAFRAQVILLIELNQGLMELLRDIRPDEQGSDGRVFVPELERERDRHLGQEPDDRLDVEIAGDFVARRRGLECRTEARSATRHDGLQVCERNPLATETEEGLNRDCATGLLALDVADDGLPHQGDVMRLDVSTYRQERKLLRTEIGELPESQAFAAQAGIESFLDLGEFGRAHEWPRVEDQGTYRLVAFCSENDGRVDGENLHPELISEHRTDVEITVGHIIRVELDTECSVVLRYGIDGNFVVRTI